MSEYDRSLIQSRRYFVYSRQSFVSFFTHDWNIKQHVGNILCPFLLFGLFDVLCSWGIDTLCDCEVEKKKR